MMMVVVTKNQMIQGHGNSRNELFSLFLVSKFPVWLFHLVYNYTAGHNILLQECTMYIVVLSKGSFISTKFVAIIQKLQY